VGAPSDEDRAAAAAAVEYILGEVGPREEQASDYEYNLLVVARAGRVTSRTSGLSASMIPAYQRAMQQMIERTERAKREANASPVPTGRVVIEGVVTRVWTKDTAFGTREVMTVMGDGGWSVWGTQPTSLYEAKQGDRVRFTATVEQSEGNHAFGFFKRPSKAEITHVSEAA
jgi:hypothetical protein